MNSLTVTGYIKMQHRELQFLLLCGWAAVVDMSQPATGYCILK